MLQEYDKFMTFLTALLFSVQSANAMNLDAFMDKHIAPVSNAVADIIFYPIKIFGAEIPIIIFWILIAGLFFTIYLKGIPIWGFMHAIHSIFKPSKEQKTKIKSFVREISRNEELYSLYKQNKKLKLLTKSHYLLYSLACRLVQRKEGR